MIATLLCALFAAAQVPAAPAATDSSSAPAQAANASATRAASAAADGAPRPEALPALTQLPATEGATPAELEALRKLAQSGAPASLPPVTARMYTVGGRLELSPAFTFSVGDPFFRSTMLGLRLEQHVSERWSLGGHLFAGASMVAAPVDLCGGGPCSGPVAQALRSTPGDLQADFGLEAGYRPVYGKLSLLGEKTVHFDMYFTLGPELLRERIAPDAASAPSGRWALGGRAAVGERIYLSDRLSIRAGAAEIVYGARVRGRVELERKLMLEGGVSFLFGAR
jgi:outer membrane beta-barrel protein